MPDEVEQNEELCGYCAGQGVVTNIPTNDRIACRVCLGTGRGPLPYENDLGGEARLRELRRIGELVEQREVVLSAFEFLRPWFEQASATVDRYTEGMPEEKRAEYRKSIAPTQNAVASVLKMLGEETAVRPRPET